MDDSDPADPARRAGRAALAAALVDARAATLATFDAFAAALAPVGLRIPYAPVLNPPIWELGHVGWFQDWWIGRNPERDRGLAADPDAPRRPPRLEDADAAFDSSRIAHRDRWERPLPPADALRRDLAAGLAETLDRLDRAEETDPGLYFGRLALFHEDMHREAGWMMAQQLGLPLDAPPPAADPERRVELAFDGGVHELGGAAGDGFAFDNELGRHEVHLRPFTIDAAPVRWAELLGFIADGGYDRRALWSDDGWAWRVARGAGAGGAALPAHLRRDGDRWQRRAFGRWVELDPTLPAMNLSAHEAEAHARWAGRRLPTEAEWEHAALAAGTAFRWGQVWEWTATRFGPYPGFVAHPYRDYSAPWFADGRRVLRGGSFATAPRMKHRRYRNFFHPDRSDAFAGFRTCADARPARADR